MRRKNASHIIRITIGSLLGIFGVLSVALLVLTIYAGVTKTHVSVGLGDFDVGVAPTDFQLIEHRLHFGQPDIVQSANPASTPVCYLGNIHQAAFWAVSLYVQTCDIWANQPRPGAVPTAPSKVYPSPVYTAVPTITAP